MCSLPELRELRQKGVASWVLERLVGYYSAERPLCCCWAHWKDRKHATILFVVPWLTWTCRGRKLLAGVLAKLDGGPKPSYLQLTSPTEASCWDASKTHWEAFCCSSSAIHWRVNALCLSHLADKACSETGNTLEGDDHRIFFLLMAEF